MKDEIMATECRWCVTWVWPDGKVMWGSPLSKADAEAAAARGNKKFPEILHTVSRWSEDWNCPVL